MSTQAPTKNTVNGIDVDQLHQTVEAVAAERSLGEFEFRASNEWQGGTHNRTVIGSFHGAGEEHADRGYMLDCGEPHVLCGGEEGANPVEHLLNALAGCMTTTMAAHCAAQGISIDAIESKLDGDIDLGGFLGIDDTVEKGYSEIRVKFKVKSKDATEEQLRTLAESSPVFNTVTRPTPVRIEFELE